MKLTRKALMFAVSASLFLTACGGGNHDNGLYYNNYTGADTEGFEFLKVVFEEANYQQKASSKVGDSQLAEEIKQTYGTISKEIYDLADRQNVLAPNVNVDYELDSVDVNDLIKSQERIVSQFKRVTHNTNADIADYAKDNLPKLEQLLVETKSGK